MILQGTGDRGQGTGNRKMSNNAISIHNLSKTFYTGFFRKKHLALDSLDLQVEQGEILGYLGPNGSGKTTTFKLLLGLIFPDHGRFSFFGGEDQVATAKSRIGYLPENPYFYAYLTGAESLNFHGRLYGMETKRLKERAAELLLQDQHMAKRKHQSDQILVPLDSENCKG